MGKAMGKKKNMFVGTRFDSRWDYGIQYVLRQISTT